MKKLFVCALAVGMFTACSQDETIEMQSPMQISFNGAYVENATRAAVDPSITTNNIANFDVWGFMNEAAGVVFDREAVTKSGTDWAYMNTQYWMPNKTYYFAAVSPVDRDNIKVTKADHDDAQYGLGTIHFNNVDGSEDLLYAAVAEPIVTPSTITQQPAPVHFTFNHMLSKVKFSFKNGFTNSNTTLVVKQISMTAPKSGSINVAQSNWWSTNQWVLDNETNETFALDFSNGQNMTLGALAQDECAQERLTIPADKEQKYTVKFYVELYQGQVKAMEGWRTALISGVALEIGKAYHFTADLNAYNLTDDVIDNPLYPITFTAEVKDWVDAGTQVGNLNNVSVDANETLTLVSNGYIQGSVNVQGTLDGGGHTLFGVEHPTDNGLIRPAGQASIMNVVVDGDNKSTAEGAGVRAIYITNGGKYLIDNVVTHETAYALNVTTTEAVELNVINSTLEGWTSYSALTTAKFEGVNFTVGNFYTTNTYSRNDNGLLRPYGQTTLKDCHFAAGFVLDLGSLTTGTVVLLNCYYNDTLITAENIQDLDFIDNYDANKVAFENN